MSFLEEGEDKGRCKDFVGIESKDGSMVTGKNVQVERTLQRAVGR